MVNSSPVVTPVGMTSPTSSLDGAAAVAVAYGRAAKAMKTIGWSEPAAFLAVLADPGAEHQVLAATYDLTAKSLTRATAKAKAEGFLVGNAGAWVVVLPALDGDGSSSPTDVKKNLADRLAVAEAGLLRFGGHKYGSPLERDVALVLTGAKLRFEVQQPYTSFVKTERAWTADFVVKTRVEHEAINVVVEATGRSDAAATIDEKVKALDGAHVPYVVVRGPGDLDGLVQRVVEVAKAAVAERVTVKSDGPLIPDDQKPRVIGGVYVNPRAVRRPGYVPTPAPLVEREPLPPLPPPPPIPGLDLSDSELRRLEELQVDADDRFILDQMAAARAELAQLRASETPDQKKERAAELLKRDYETWRAEHGAAAVAERRHQQMQGHADAVAAYRPEDGERELTGEESAEQDELPDDTEANRGE